MEAVGGIRVYRMERKKIKKKKERKVRKTRVYVTGNRMWQLLNGWLTDEEHDRLIRFGENSFQVFFSW